MDQQSRERRKSKRITANLEVKIQIMHPQDTISKRSFAGRVSNMTEKEARITLFDVSSRYYQKLIKDRELRNVRMSCKFPASEDESRLHGRIHYLNYYGKGERNLCEIAIQFWDLEEIELARLKEFLRDLKQKPAAE